MNIYQGEFGVNNQLFFCGLPFRLDSYSGCSHGCKYCFARSAELTNASNKSRVAPILVPEPRHFKRYLTIALDQGLKRSDINIEWLRHRVPIHWGGMSDPFQPCESKYKVSKKWMEYLNWYQYPVVISTKGTTLLTSPEYLKLLKEGNYAVQITLIGDNDELIGQLEPAAPNTTDRIRAIYKLVDAGIWVAVRIQPVFPNSILEDNLPEFAYKLGNFGVKHILAEGFKTQDRNIEWMLDIAKLLPNTMDEYRAYVTTSFGFEKLLPAWRKWQYIKVLLQACHESGMTFGAADNELRDLGDTICCCGIDNLPGFENWWRYQSSQAAAIAKDKGSVTLNDMQVYWSGGNGKIAEQAGAMRNYAHSNKFKITAKYCVDYMWNQGGECSPEVMVSMTKTQLNGQIAYTYQDPIPMLESQQVKQANMFEYIARTQELGRKQ